VRSIDQVAEDPQVEHRRMVQGVRHPQSGLEMRSRATPSSCPGCVTRSATRRCGASTTTRSTGSGSGSMRTRSPI
jgi:crotonobetainyl-CoA:carnitine CoA-transferase CaiB-like acyl-CoA transferase